MARESKAAPAPLRGVVGTRAKGQQNGNGRERRTEVDILVDPRTANTFQQKQEESAQRGDLQISMFKGSLQLVRPHMQNTRKQAVCRSQTTPASQCASSPPQAHFFNICKITQWPSTTSCLYMVTKVVTSHVLQSWGVERVFL